MKLQMQSVNFNADKGLLEFVQRKLDKLETFHDRIIEGDVYLRLENNDDKDNKAAHIKIFLPGTSIMAKEQGASFEEAVDLAYENLQRQLKKHKGKISTY